MNKSDSPREDDQAKEAGSDASGPVSVERTNIANRIMVFLQQLRGPAAKVWKYGDTSIVILLGALAGLIVAYQIPEHYLVAEDHDAHSTENSANEGHDHTGKGSDAKEFWACPMF